jgi:hypothetical protein
MVFSQSIYGRAARRVDGNDDAYMLGISQLGGRGAHTIHRTNSSVGKNIFRHPCRIKGSRSTNSAHDRNLAGTLEAFVSRLTDCCL